MTPALRAATNVPAAEEVLQHFLDTFGFIVLTSDRELPIGHVARGCVSIMGHVLCEHPLAVIGPSSELEMLRQETAFDTRWPHLADRPHLAPRYLEFFYQVKAE